MKKLLFFWKELLATFWFLPVLILGLAILFSIGLVSLDKAITLSQDNWLRFFLVNSAASARSILSTISGAMIGVAGTVFSVTLVALTLASSQFGSRLIKNFMYVRLNQVVLGSYIATYLYCLLILNSIREGDGYSFIPSLSILVAIFAAISNIVLLIVFIHRIAVSIQADKVISDISETIAKQVQSLFPQKMGDEEQKDKENDPERPDYRHRLAIHSPKSGYLQYVSSEALIKLMEEEEAFLKLNYRPGMYLVKGVELVELSSNERWDEQKISALLNQFIIGNTKTSHQDLEFSIHQMVEIASRALSPGINDPFTAITCIDNLTATMSYLAEAEFPSKYRFDEQGKLRVQANTLDFEGVLNAAFNQIRQFSAGSTAVIIRLMEALITIHGFTRTEDHRQAVIKHAQMVSRIGNESIKEENDLKDLAKRASLIVSQQ